jgi:hypothetical protein
MVSAPRSLMNKNLQVMHAPKAVDLNLILTLRRLMAGLVSLSRKAWHAAVYARSLLSSLAEAWKSGTGYRSLLTPCHTHW